jgi:anti-sigma-K factor RskA
MTEGEDIDALAAEYVLGSLDVDERKDVAIRRTTDAVLDRAIKKWETHLGPLNDRLPGIEPPAHVFRNLSDRLWPRQRQSTKLTRTHFSRRAAIAASALAACLALAVVWLRDQPGIPPTFMAQLQPNGAEVDDKPHVWTPFGFTVSFDLRASTIVVSPVAAGVSSTRDYQLWLLPRERAPPISLGLIALPETTTSAWLATYPPNDLINTTLAVSLEQKGGSPIGIPSGPLVFVGKIFQTP